MNTALFVIAMSGCQTAAEFTVTEAPIAITAQCEAAQVTTVYRSQAVPVVTTYRESLPVVMQQPTYYTTAAPRYVRARYFRPRYYRPWRSVRRYATPAVYRASYSTSYYRPSYSTSYSTSYYASRRALTGGG